MPYRHAVAFLSLIVGLSWSLGPIRVDAQFQSPGHYTQPMRTTTQPNFTNSWQPGPAIREYPVNGGSWPSMAPALRTAANSPTQGGTTTGQQVTSYQNPNSNSNTPQSLLAQTPQNAANSSESDREPLASGSRNPSGADSVISVSNLLQLFHDGGIMMYPIALSSMICLVFVFERLIFLRRGRVIPKPFVRKLIEQLELQQLDRDEVIELCEKNPSPMANMIASAAKKYGRPAVEVEQAALDAGERIGNQLRKHLRIFSSISNLSPLFGLLGTVLGMIETFHAIASADAMGRPQLLAGGISQAMLSTAAGLIVAIPAFIAYTFFVGHTDRLVIEMDSHAQQVVEAISAEGLQESDSSRSRGRSKKAA